LWEHLRIVLLAPDLSAYPIF